MNKTITITGASSEIGMAIMRRLDASCDRLLLHCSAKRERLEQASRTLATPHEILCADFSDEHALAEFCRTVAKSDVLINAAAVTETDLLPMLGEEQIHAMLRVNVFALIKVCQAVIPYMISRRNGVVVNISSVAASRGNRGQTVYGGTKGFMESFSRALAAEGGARNVRVNCVAPGPIDAGSLKTLMAYASEEIADSLTTKRLGTPDDIAAMVAYLCSDDAAFITGQIFGVDGGFMRGV